MPLGRRNIERRITGKEIMWAQQEACMRYGHDRPVFQARIMLNVDVVPHREDSILDVAVRGSPRRQSRSTAVLIGIIPRRVALIGMIRRYPEMVPGEPGPLQNA